MQCTHTHVVSHCVYTVHKSVELTIYTEIIQMIQYTSTHGMVWNSGNGIGRINIAVHARPGMDDYVRAQQPVWKTYLGLTNHTSQLSLTTPVRLSSMITSKWAVMLCNTERRQVLPFVKLCHT